MEKKGFFAEFRDFIARGNVMDMAVGVIIGGAFKSIIDALVNSILMPFLGIFLKTESLAAMAVEVNGAVITYGAFIAAIINFLIMALVIFLMVKTINGMHEKMEARKKAEEPAAEPEPEAPAAPTEAELLQQILAVLKEKD